MPVLSLISSPSPASEVYVMETTRLFIATHYVLLLFQQAELNGEDYERVKMLETSASELERRERKKKKKNPDTGFAGDFDY